MKTCSMKDCNNVVNRGGYCPKCKSEYNRNYDTNNKRVRPIKVAEWLCYPPFTRLCERPECFRKHYANGYCKRHDPIYRAERNQYIQKRDAAVSHKVTAKELKQLRAADCVSCGAKAPNTVDHIVPLNRGGAHSIGNMTTLCGSCNSSKQNRLWIEWKHGKPVPFRTRKTRVKEGV